VASQSVVDEWASSLFKVSPSLSGSYFFFLQDANFEKQHLQGDFSKFQEMDYQAEARNGIRFR
jgi:hypothetical protein